MINVDENAQKIATVLLLCILGFAISTILTPLYTKYAYKYKFWKRERSNATTGEKLKIINKLSVRDYAVPTAAGVIFVAAISLVTLKFNLSREQTWLPLAALLGGGFVGLIDDLINVRSNGKGVAGMRAPVKFAMITIIGIIAAWFCYYKLGYQTIHLPLVGDLLLGWAIIPLFVLAVVSTGNAVNISDGLDGLAGGLLLSAYSAFGFIAILQGNYGIAGFCFTVVGALLSYLWFNIAPARFFMGDVGSFSLGTALGVVAMLTDTLFLLPIIGAIFVLEAGSSLTQIMSKKLRNGKKIFIAAPIHHHFEASGWPKTKVTMRFWILGIMFSILGIFIAVIGGY